MKKPDAATETSQPQSAQPQSAQPQSAQPQSAQPQSAQPQSAQPQSAQTIAAATIVNELGLHLRAAARFVAVASQWQCQVRVSTDGPEVDGKSLLALSSLLARCGTVLTIRCEGDGHAQAALALSDVVTTGFRDSPRLQ